MTAVLTAKAPRKPRTPRTAISLDFCHCERSEAIHGRSERSEAIGSRFERSKSISMFMRDGESEDCFVASLLAMTRFFGVLGFLGALAVKIDA